MSNGYSSSSSTSSSTSSSSSEQKEKIMTKEEAQKLLYLKQRVIARVWTSAGNVSRRGENVGHASIQTPNSYMSLWPQQNQANGRSAKENEEQGLFKVNSHELLPDFSVDVKYEDRLPEFTFCFYSLDVDAIEKRFNDIKETLEGWALLGLCKDAQSCASLAWELLVAGGIEKLAGKLTQSSVASKGSTQGSFFAKKGSTNATVQTVSSNQDGRQQASNESKAASLYSSEMAISGIVKSPDYLGELLQTAKQKELENSPLTTEIKFENDTKKGQETEWKPTPKSSGSCLILEHSFVLIGSGMSA